MIAWKVCVCVFVCVSGAVINFDAKVSISSPLFLFRFLLQHFLTWSEFVLKVFQFEKSGECFGGDPCSAEWLRVVG